jgi:hypothetical protein
MLDHWNCESNDSNRWLPAESAIVRKPQKVLSSGGALIVVVSLWESLYPPSQILGCSLSNRDLDFLFAAQLIARGRTN